MNNEMFNAILAMDAYNRGYRPSIRFSTRIGNDSMEAQLGIVWTKDAVDFPLVT